jgi:hypothetical protein
MASFWNLELPDECIETWVKDVAVYSMKYDKVEEQINMKKVQTICGKNIIEVKSQSDKATNLLRPLSSDKTNLLRSISSTPIFTNPTPPDFTPQNLAQTDPISYNLNDELNNLTTTSKRVCDILNEYLQDGRSLMIQNEQGANCLHLLARFSYTKYLELENQLDCAQNVAAKFPELLNQRNNNDERPLECAIKNQHWDMFVLFMMMTKCFRLEPDQESILYYLIDHRKSSRKTITPEILALFIAENQNMLASELFILHPLWVVIENHDWDILTAFPQFDPSLLKVEEEKGRNILHHMFFHLIDITPFDITTVCEFLKTRITKEDMTKLFKIKDKQKFSPLSLLFYRIIQDSHFQLKNTSLLQVGDYFYRQIPFSEINETKLILPEYAYNTLRIFHEPAFRSSYFKCHEAISHIISQMMIQMLYVLRKSYGYHAIGILSMIFGCAVKEERMILETKNSVKVKICAMSEEFTYLDIAYEDTMSDVALKIISKLRCEYSIFRSMKYKEKWIVSAGELMTNCTVRQLGIEDDEFIDIFVSRS